jgi:RNA polymerase sigma-70 factor (ECF subfamily)
MILLVLPDNADDDLLLRAARNGDKAAITQIYQAYLEPIYQFTRFRVGNAQIAEDITGSVFLKFIDGLDRGKGPRRNLRAWLFRVARSEIADHYGTRDRELPMETVETSFDERRQSPGPETELLQSLASEEIRTALQQMRPEYQEVVLLRFDQQLSLQETADVMGRNINTVKTLQYRAINRMRELIQQRQLMGGAERDG